MFVRSQAALAFVSLLGLVHAQIDPESVDLATREQWCLAQEASCPLLCLQTDEDGDLPAANTCDVDTLGYYCVCSNGLEPNATEYSQTIPYFICTEINNRCVEACGQQSTCAANCRENNPCGAQNPTRVTTTAIPEQTEEPTETGSAPDAEETEDDGSGFEEDDAAIHSLALGIGRVYGVAVLVAGFLGGFALVV